MPSAAHYRSTVLKWFETEGRDFPWRRESDLYRLLVAEVLLQRTRGENVLPVYAEFLARWASPIELARAHTSSIKAVIRPLGLSKKASVLKSLGKALRDKADIPMNPKALAELPGVGPYASHSVPVFAGKSDLPVVDWVIARVLRRYFGLSPGRRPNADSDLWSLASSLIKKGNARALWLGTLDFGAAICKPRPLCKQCPLSARCAFFAESGN